MKELILAGMLVFLGAGCSAQNLDDGFVSVGWGYDEFLGQICLDGVDQEMSPSVAEGIGYPNQPMDHLCVSRDTADLLHAAPGMGDTGTAMVRLANLALISEMNGRIYEVDVAEAR